MITVNFSPEVEQKQAQHILKELSNDAKGGWIDLPHHVDMAEFVRIKETAQKIQDESECLVCIGIGGSYLGHRAVIEALGMKSDVQIVYAGNSLSERELRRAMDEVGERDFSIDVISKSGNTLEIKIAYEAFYKKLVEKYGAREANQRVYVTTDAKEGALLEEANRNGYTKFVIPDNVGGRYSVLTSVGLLPMAVAGIDIDKLLEGAAGTDVDIAIKYAYMRDLLRRKAYDTEVFASFEPATGYFLEWLKQLFGESEGKNKQGVLPTSVIYSTDLHSMGQFMQDGRRNLWETIVDVPTDELNTKVVTAVRAAHTTGGIPVLDIAIDSYDERGFGELIYFFEIACAVSAKLIGVNPFDQPGVEAYKENLRKLMEVK